MMPSKEMSAEMQKLFDAYSQHTYDVSSIFRAVKHGYMTDYGAFTELIDGTNKLVQTIRAIREKHVNEQKTSAVQAK